MLRFNFLYISIFFILMFEAAVCVCVCESALERVCVREVLIVKPASHTVAVCSYTHCKTETFLMS